jgi:hypothetical protein
MASVDPFAGIGDSLPLVQAGSLDGMNYEEPLAGVEGSPEPWAPEQAPKTDHTLTPEEAAAQVVEGSLGGEGDEGAPTEEEQLDADLSAALVEEDPEPDPTVASPTPEDVTTEPESSSPSSPTTSGPDSTPESGSTDSDSTASQPSKPKRTRRKAAPIAEAEEPDPTHRTAGRQLTTNEPPGNTTREWVILTEGKLDNDEPFWYVMMEVMAGSREAALRKAYNARAEGTDAITVRALTKNSFRPFTIGIQQVPQPPVEKLVIS